MTHNLTSNIRRKIIKVLRTLICIFFNKHGYGGYVYLSRSKW